MKTFLNYKIYFVLIIVLSVFNLLDAMKLEKLSKIELQPLFKEFIEKNIKNKELRNKIFNLINTNQSVTKEEIIDALKSKKKIIKWTGKKVHYANEKINEFLSDVQLAEPDNETLVTANILYQIVKPLNNDSETKPKYLAKCAVLGHYKAQYIIALKLEDINESNQLLKSSAIQGNRKALDSLSKRLSFWDGNNDRLARALDLEVKTLEEKKKHK